VPGPERRSITGQHAALHDGLPRAAMMSLGAAQIGLLAAPFLVTMAVRSRHADQAALCAFSGEVPVRHREVMCLCSLLPVVPESVISGTAATGGARPGQPVPETSPGTACRTAGTGTVSGTMGTMTTAPVYDNSVRIGYARVSTRAQEHQAQLDALAAAHCREIIVETASTRGDRPKLREALGKLQVGDTLVIYKPDRVARSMKELLVLLEDQLHARGINLHILTGICAGIHRPDGATIADKMLFMVAAMAAEMERDLIRERTLDGLRAAETQGRRGGRPAAVNDDILAIARARQSRGESVTAIARHLKIGRSTLYRALQPDETDLALAAVEPAR
jgi:DNA invertase Pin-like site-specific DNA recombinase